jgi:hypothetical protein
VEGVRGSQAGIFLIIAGDDDDRADDCDVTNYDTLHSRIVCLRQLMRLVRHILSKAVRSRSPGSPSSIIERFLISGIAETRECNRSGSRLESSKEAGKNVKNVCSAGNGESCVPRIGQRYSIADMRV